MTPETLQRINDLRMRVVLADEATRSGDHDAAARLMPSDAEIIEALKAARTERSSTIQAKADRAASKKASNTLTSIDVNALFEGL